MSEKTGRPESEIEKDLQDMFRKGLCFKKEKQGQPTSWRAPMHIAQFHDASIVWPEATREFLNAWEAYMERNGRFLHLSWQVFCQSHILA
ncbi:MAG: hypothetical protein R2875_14090 [Desulfobacterales bacterium]